MKVNPKKVAALIDQHAKKKAPAKFPGKGGGKPPPSKHAQEEADDEPGESAEHEAQEHGEGGHDESKDAEIAQQQMARIENGNGDDELDGIIGGEEYEAGAEPPDWAKDHDIYERAEKAAESLGDVEDDKKMLLMIHIYQALGGKLDGMGGEDEGDESEEEDDGEPEDEEHDDEAPEDL